MSTMQPIPRIPVPREAIAGLCRRYRVRRLSFFGSVIRDDFGPESDVDILLELEPGSGIGFIGLGQMEEELSEMLGRKVDLVTPGGLSHLFRDTVVQEAMPVYDAA